MMSRKQNHNRSGKLRTYVLFALCAISLFLTSVSVGFDFGIEPVNGFFVVSGLLCSMIVFLFAMIVTLILTPE